MPKTPEASAEGQKKENKSERGQELSPDFDARYVQIENAIESGDIHFPPMPDDYPEFYFLLARGGALFHKAVERGLIEITENYIDRLVSLAAKETVLGGAAWAVPVKLIETPCIFILDGIKTERIRIDAILRIRLTNFCMGSPRFTVFLISPKGRIPRAVPVGIYK